MCWHTVSPEEERITVCMDAMLTVVSVLGGSVGGSGDASIEQCGVRSEKRV